MPHILDALNFRQLLHNADSTFAYHRLFLPCAMLSLKLLLASLLALLVVLLMRHVRDEKL
tara:strand:- start:227 stop:406 length:180 start_codon:yes stop_codon:yes gene_type:complete